MRPIATDDMAGVSVSVCWAHRWAE